MGLAVPGRPTRLRRNPQQPEPLSLGESGRQGQPTLPPPLVPGPGGPSDQRPAVQWREHRICWNNVPSVRGKGNSELRCVLAARTFRDEKVLTTRQKSRAGQRPAPARRTTGSWPVLLLDPRRAVSVGPGRLRPQDTTPWHRRQAKSADTGRRNPGPAGRSGVRAARPGGADAGTGPGSGRAPGTERALRFHSRS